jgi:hypothetical protein
MLAPGKQAPSTGAAEKPAVMIPANVTVRARVTSSFAVPALVCPTSVCMVARRGLTCASHTTKVMDHAAAAKRPAHAYIDVVFPAPTKLARIW